MVGGYLYPYLITFFSKYLSIISRGLDITIRVFSNFSRLECLICTLQPKSRFPRGLPHDLWPWASGPSPPVGSRARWVFNPQPSYWRPKVPPASFRDRRPPSIGRRTELCLFNLLIICPKVPSSYPVNHREWNCVCYGFWCQPSANLRGVSPSRVNPQQSSDIVLVLLFAILISDNIFTFDLVNYAIFLKQ